MPDHEAEWKTRRQRIDPRLRAAGWDIVSFKADTPVSSYKRHAVVEYPTETGPADYALFVNGALLGIVEGKKVALGTQSVLIQAERYSRGATSSPLIFGEFHVPFLYATNGEIVHFRDVRDTLNLSRTIDGFHTPAALEEMMERNLDEECQWFARNRNDHPLIRDYQVEANDAIEQAIADRKRRMLIAMATGTGKTFTMVNQTYRLMKSGVARRVLFLVDRRALAAQAVQAFASFEVRPGMKFDKEYEVYSQRFHRDDLGDEKPFDPNVMPNAYLMKPDGSQTFVYVCTIQRMMINLFGRNVIPALGDEVVDDDAEQMNIPINAFDVIIADECHRGYTAQEVSLWRNTLEHFDAIKIGLTATPAAHTTTYFHDVVFRYSYERAVREGYLVDYDAVRLRSDVRMNGVFLEEGALVGVVDTETGREQMDLLEDQRTFEAPEVEEKVTSPDSNRKIIEEIADYAQQHQARFGRFPKTLIFAANDLPHRSHADQLVKIAREFFGKGDGFVQKITGRVDRPLQRIREFRNRPDPRIVVSVDLMSTGVDIPNLEFIVLLRPVKSRILFEQMLGRGTRKGVDECFDKTHFTVFDCFDGTLLDYFRQATAITADVPRQEVRTIVEIIEAIWNNEDREYNTRCLVKRLQRIDKDMSGNARLQFARFIEDGDVSKFAASLPERLERDFSRVMGTLRDPEFQALLVNYERKRDTFVVDYATKDTVTSELLFRDAAGNTYKPGDYIEAFARFVHENPAQIEAIRILLERPRDWSTDALVELQKKLSSTREFFTVDKLQEAHRLRYDKALADIISMIKHAANEANPLFTAEERVEHAFFDLFAAQDFTPEQERWLERIREHMIQNLSISRQDFEEIPILADPGGWGPADRAFGGRLDDIIRQINEAVAA